MLGGGREEAELQLWGMEVAIPKFSGENGDMRRNLERKRNKMEGTSLSTADTTGPLDVSRAFISSGLPERASGGRGWPGLFGWIKGLFWGKTRNRGRGWAE
jgi:hypothetical protein